MTLSPPEDPQFLPFKLDTVGRRILWLRLDAAQRREAAFLDDRALPPQAEGGWMPLDSLPTANTTSAFTEADAIFHIGHCGSTLLSRLLESWPEVEGLREPLPLRTLADAWDSLLRPESRLSPTEATRLLQALWSRWSQTLAPHKRSVVKATSSCNGLIEPLLSQQSTMRAILLDMPLRPYLTTLLKSPGSVHDAANAAAERLRNLHARGYGDGIALHGLTLPQQCAMGWLAERLRFSAIAQGEHGARVLRMDFEDLLADPERDLRRLAAHLQLDPAGVAEALASSAWGRYSKSQSHGYGREDRVHDLDLAAQRYGKEIAEGEAWVEAFVHRHPGLRDVVFA